MNTGEHDHDDQRRRGTTVTAVTGAGGPGDADPRPRGRRWRFGAAPAPGCLGDGWNADVRGESRVRRADRNFADILQETRVLQTGVQILFALVVTGAFTGRFSGADAFVRSVYVVTLTAVVGAAALLIAPVAYHRAFFRAGRKRELVDRSHQLVRTGLVALMVALSGSLVLVLEMVLERPVAVAVASTLTVALYLLWFVLPARARRRHGCAHPDCDDETAEADA